MSETPAYTKRISAPEFLAATATRLELAVSMPRDGVVQYDVVFSQDDASETARALREVLGTLARLQSREAELAGALQAMREDAAGTREDYERLKPYAHADQLNFMRGWFECAEHYIPALSPSPGEEG